VRQAIADLARLPGVWRGGELEHAVHEVAATGHAALDRELPGGGWPLATLSEVLHDGVGIGEVRFLFGALSRASEGERMMAWINAPHLPYAPALAQRGIALERCTVVRPATREDALWAAEQALRSGACGAVLLWLESSLSGERRSRGGEYAWLRRLQLAAQAGRSMAVLFRSTAAEASSTPAHLRVVLALEAGRLTLRIPKRRGPPLGAPIVLEGPATRSVPTPHAPALVPVDPPRALPRIVA
jgi:cell division inhibitor SulA/protein ImuA